MLNELMPALKQILISVNSCIGRPEAIDDELLDQLESKNTKPASPLLYKLQRAMQTFEAGFSNC